MNTTPSGTMYVKNPTSFYAFGDIHGEYYKLKRLLSKISYEDSCLIFLGDYIDRGQWSFEVVEFLINLSKNCTTIFLRGNHDDMFMDYLSGINEQIFIFNGGRKTIESYEKHGWNIDSGTYYLDRVLPRKHITFFQKLKNYYETDDFIFVHAGIVPGVPMEQQNKEMLLWDRSFSFVEDYEGKVVVHGHSPKAQVVNKKYEIGLDTGACFESMGNLTCVKLPERIFHHQGWHIEDERIV